MATKKWKVAVGCDPNAAELKETIKELLKAEGHSFEDFGSDDPIYPNVAFKVGEAVASGKFDRGILVCGTGIGMSMAANRVPGIRAALCVNEYLARMTRLHNDANVLCLGERVIGTGLAVSIAEVFLETAFEGGRHQRRVDLIESCGLAAPL